MFLGHGPARRWRALHRHRLALTAASHSNNTAAQHLPDDREINIKLSTWRKAGWRLDFCRQASSWVSAFATWRSPATALSSSSPSSAPVGLFGRPGLLRPQDWIRLANETQARCDELLSQLLSLSPPDHRVVQLMDDMSDELCRTYDAAECCRNVHVDPAWRAAAGRACVQLGAYISTVNHHEGMYRQLCAALDAAEADMRAQGQGRHGQGEEDQARGGGADGGQGSSLPCPSGPAPLPPGWDREALLVGQKLRMDMEQAGIHLPGPQRRRTAALAADNGHYAAAFSAALTDPAQVGRLSLPGGRSLLLDPAGVAGVMAGEPDEDIRRKVYLASGVSPAANGPLLSQMVAARREMAGLMGHPSYASLRMAGGSVAGAPSAVRAFLTRLAGDVRPMAEQEMRVLARLKAAEQGGTSPSSCPAPLAAWDVEYYAARRRAALAAAEGAGPTAVARYLELPAVLQGLRVLLRRLFRVSLHVSPCAPGEGWAPGVLRAEAEHQQLGFLGTVYLDLQDRPDKYPSAVTFPITCGRELPRPAGTSPASSPSSPGESSPSSRGAPRQYPVMALLASASGVGPRGHPALSWRELRVLLHEMGHVLHNLLSRTRFQHLWGTRCAQDLVEVPSHLLEHCAPDPR